MYKSTEAKTIAIDTVKTISDGIFDHLNEKERRRFAALAAKAIGYGGVTAVSQITGMSRSTIESGMSEINQDDPKGSDEEDKPEVRENLEVSEKPGNTVTNRIRKEGAGRKSAKEKNPGLYSDIEEVVREQTYGTPTQPLCWTTLSLRKIAGIVQERYGIVVSQNIVSRALTTLGYSKQKNQKNLEDGPEHPDRDAQFKFINDTAAAFLEEGEPVISIDTKKKELIGPFLNEGREYRKKGDPQEVLVHDFVFSGLGKVIPYGVYVVNDNTGFVNLGTDHDTAEFAGESILRWWGCVGAKSFPNATKLYITADSGGSNGARIRLWKYALQHLSNMTGLEIHVSHYPSGTSKWNKIEHRLFCYISKNREGRPLIDIETVVSLISSTTTTSGLRVICEVDENKYDIRKKVPDEVMDRINIERCDQFGQWNYIIRPQNDCDKFPQDELIIL